MTSNQRFGYAFGGFFLLVGLLAFLPTGEVDAASMSGGKHPFVLGLFTPCPFLPTPLHSLIHLGAGVVLVLGAAWGDRIASTVNKLGSAIYLLLGLSGSVLVALGTDRFVMYHTFVYLAFGVLAVAGSVRASVLTDRSTAEDECPISSTSIAPT
jgi:hypothetical protein